MSSKCYTHVIHTLLANIKHSNEIAKSTCQADGCHYVLIGDNCYCSDVLNLSIVMCNVNCPEITNKLSGMKFGV